MEMFNSTQSLGEIVSILPKAGEIFKEYKIDFCCGGNRPLKEVLQEKQVSEEEIMQQINKAYDDTRKIKTAVRDFRNMSRSELIDYIVHTHHAYLKKALPRTGELTAKIMGVHGVNHEELFRVHKIFSSLRAELEQHLVKEEEVLFPLLKEYDRHPTKEAKERIRKVMRETENEHEAAGSILKELRIITRDYEVPKDGCSTYCLAFNALEELEGDLFQHIHLENNILFKTVEAG